MYCVLLSANNINAQLTLSDDAKISLMTTAPWPEEIYAVYGHTALYVEDDSLGIDAVFNYGFFDRDEANFMYNFIRGKTDYILGVQSFDSFVYSYGYKGVEVIKQELNLSKSEKQHLWEALYINQLPENREYRYNYFYDNCVTRPRDLIEKFTEGEIQYPIDDEEQTYRDLIHECVGGYPWMKFGIDLIIGSDADKPITLRQKMFLPAYLMHALDNTTIFKQDSNPYPIVKDKVIVLEDSIAKNNIREQTPLSPEIVAFAVMILAILVSFGHYRNKNESLVIKVFDTIIFVISGAGGAVVFFLMFFSEHPATDANWNFMWLNILALFVALFFWIKPLKGLVNIYHFINFAVILIFLALWWFLPQQLPVASIPFAIALWMRSGIHVLVWKEKRNLQNRSAT